MLQNHSRKIFTGGVPDLARPTLTRLAVISTVLSAAARTANAQWAASSLNPPGASSYALGGSGLEQAGYVNVPGGRENASVWNGTAGSWINLNPTPSTYSMAFGASDGHQVGWSRVGDVYHASLWSGTAGSWVDLHPTSGTMYSQALAVAGNQQVGYVGITTAGNNHAALWTGSASGWVDLHPPTAKTSIALGTSGGQQVGYVAVDTAGNRHASLWTGSGASWVDLNPGGPSVNSEAYAVSGGQQVGYAFVGGVFAAGLWTGSAGSWTSLHPAGATASRAYGVFSGQQVGYVTVSGVSHAALWSGSATSWVDLHAYMPSGYSGSFAQCIWSHAGVTYIAGYGHRTITNKDEALLWTQSESCPADYNGDGFANGDDYDEYVLDFINGDPLADFNGDGFVTGDDFDSYVEAFEAGC